MTAINQAALIDLVRAAMLSGVTCFTERVRAGQVDLSAPLGDAFGDFPAKFVHIRSDLIDALTEANPDGGADA